MSMTTAREGPGKDAHSSSGGSRRRAAAMTTCPAAERARAVAAPIPLLAPVTRAVVIVERYRARKDTGSPGSAHYNPAHVKASKHPVPDARWPSLEEAAASRVFSAGSLGPVETLSRTWVPATGLWRCTEEGVVTPELLALSLLPL